MNRIKKSITVRFFSIEANEQFFKGFSSSFITNIESSNSTRIFNVRSKKYLVKTISLSKENKFKAYGLTVVRERNTWQVKATRDGGVTGISPNQGLLGDPYFFCIVPEKKIILGFTTGPSVSLKSVAKTMLDQFNTDRMSQLKLDLIPKEKEFSTLNELSEYSSLHFKINSSSLSDVGEDAPELIKTIGAAPYLESNMQLSLDLQLSPNSDSSLTRENVIEIVNYLSNHDGCTVLKVKGKDDDGLNVNLDFGNAFFNFKTEINTRNSFVDEASALNILDSALTDFLSANVI